ncbi:LysE family translocator [Thalassospira australica]|uniref:LysE family translocator n=1 Tax=Thalassospira australica TaxID=1528106 RepID=UPI00051A4EEA|nr:LysE family translocator [Thalassospira australica]
MSATLSLYLSMSAFALAASITPGPVNILVLSSGVQYGFRKSLRLVFGATTGFCLLLLLIGLGLHELLTVFPQMTTIIQWAGVAFLLFMAWKLFSSNGELGKENADTGPRAITGAIMQWVNPKAWLASIAGMGAYAASGAPSLIWEFTAIYFVICFASVACWAYAGAFLARFLGQPSRVQMFNRAMAVLLAASAAYLVFG